MFDYKDKELQSYIDCYMEKMRDFGFDASESIIHLINAGEKLTIEKIAKVLDYLEPVGTGCVRDDIDIETARREIERILNIG